MEIHIWSHMPWGSRSGFSLEMGSRLDISSIQCLSFHYYKMEIIMRTFPTCKDEWDEGGTGHVAYLAQNMAHVACLHKCNSTSLSLFPSVSFCFTRSHAFMKSLGDFEEQELWPNIFQGGRSSHGPWCRGADFCWGTIGFSLHFHHPESYPCGLHLWGLFSVPANTQFQQEAEG